MNCPECQKPNVEGARFCASCGAPLPLPSSDTGSLVGKVVGGRYRIIKVLGEGGMGRVYLAEQKMGTSVRKVAVKTLQAQYASDPQVVARFNRECGTVSELQHPNTIQFFDFGKFGEGDDEQLYIAMEFVQGESLSDALQRGPMPPERAVSILGQVCGSLEEAHSRGIIHRDLKPDNVILTQRAGHADFVKVLDFGIAKRSEAKDQAQEQKLTQQGMVLGTPPYMSPEQFTGKELDARSDIYSLGVMAYEMMTGRLPFEATTPWQWATQHLTAQPRPFESLPVGALVPPGTKIAVLRALSKEPTDRQRSVSQFYQELAGAAPALGSAPGALGAQQPPGGSTARMTPPEMAAMGGAATVATPAVGSPVAAISGGGVVVSGSQPRAGGKGLIIGLIAAAGALGVATIVVLSMTLRPKADVVVQSPLRGAASTTTAAMVTSDTTVPSTPGLPEIASVDTAKPPGTAPHPKAPSGPPPVPTQPPPPTLRGEAACTEARKLADNGDIQGAVRVYAGCDVAGQGPAKAAIARAAPAAVQRKVFNGDCAGAKAIAQAASGIGAGASAEAVLDKAPQCKK